MDTPNHIVQGFIMIDIFNIGIEWSIANAIIAGSLDIIPAIPRLFDKHNWKPYSYFHKKLKWMRIIPGWFFHWWEDTWVHTIGKRWWIPKEEIQRIKSENKGFLYLLYCCYKFERVSWNVNLWFFNLSYLGIRYTL